MSAFLFKLFLWVFLIPGSIIVFACNVPELVKYRDESEIRNKVLVELFVCLIIATSSILIALFA